MIPEHARLEAYLRDLMQRRPFEGYVDQPDTEARKRLAVQALPFALPPGGCLTIEGGGRPKPDDLIQIQVLTKVSDHS